MNEEEKRIKKKEYDKKYKERNKEILKIKRRAYKNNPEIKASISEYMKKYRKENKEKLSEKRKEYDHNNKDKYRKCRERYVAKNRELIRSREKKFRKSEYGKEVIAKRNEKYKLNIKCRRDTLKLVKNKTIDLIHNCEHIFCAEIHHEIYPDTKEGIIVAAGENKIYLLCKRCHCDLHNKKREIKKE